MPRSQAIANPDQTKVGNLRAIGTHRERALTKIGIRTITDLLYYFPRRYLDRTTIVRVADLPMYVNREVTAVGTVFSISTIARGKKRLVVTLADERHKMDVVFFQGHDYWRKRFQTGEVIAVSGTVNLYGRTPNMVHPDIDRLQQDESLNMLNTGGIIPVYPSSSDLERVGLNGNTGFRTILRSAVTGYVDGIQEYFSTGFLHRKNMPPLDDALRSIHFPNDRKALEAARYRLIFDEFFWLSLQLAYQKRRKSNTETGIAFKPESPKARALIDSLPYSLTGAQKRALKEITANMTQPHPMNRLLQGDVGSGKTVVALLTMLLAVDNGYQAALMVPTEVLAEQHFRTITSLFNDLSVNIQLLTGHQKNSSKSDLYSKIASGNVDIVVGTHALIQEAVEFGNLGYVVIDEQHRFGVMQRATLQSKGITPDVLVMTATPIPRTLSMTLYGDLDVSVIDEMPANRKQIKSAIRFEEDREKVYGFIADEINNGSQAYIVYPLVSESEKMDLQAATEGFELLKEQVFPEFRVGLLHGQMKSEEKDATMMAFKRGELQILVSTTVIEVGVDVANATVMLIENAERFGLSQLHQLRGRVGRGDKQSYCILMTKKSIYFSGGAKATDEKKTLSDSRRRLDTMRDYNDGFKIAEIDMDIRGPGDLWGTMQSGYPELRLASLTEHGDILSDARAEAFALVDEDPHLRLPEHATLREVFKTRIKDKLVLSSIA
ncbi:MAG: ATP-dependent DNA helicase RecG [Ectothiorhodospiraceae bacterium]|nr:ATP-dependent DNA helicase RecG [Ectothiorhodospiraceae bacterium]